MYFSFRAHFAITSLVVFAELSVLLCYEVFVLRFYLQNLNLRLIYVLSFCLSQLNFVGAVSHFKFHSFVLNFIVLHSISLFLHWLNCTVH